MALRGRLCLTVGTWTFSILAPASAHAAQSADNTTSTVEDRSVRDDIEELEPIIVTARRREEEIQQIPLSVISLGGDQLEARSLNNLRGLQNFVPNLTFAPSQNVGDAAGNVFIRGIGQEDFLAGSEPGIGFYLDGVYVARTMGTLMNLVDVDRIEVLRGPQGTLYGKNAIGGAINLISKAPKPGLAGYVDITVASLDRAELRGMLNAPLADTLLLRLVAARISRNGYLKRLRPSFAPSPIVESERTREGSERSTAGRIHLRWLANPSLKIDFAADASSRRGTQAPTHVDAIDSRYGILPFVNQLIRDSELPGPEISSGLVTSDLLKSFAGGGNFISQNVQGVSVVTVQELGQHSIKLIAAHRRLRSHVETDLDGTWFAILENEFRERHRQNLAELQANGTVGRFDYTAGLFGLRERTHTNSGRGVGRLDVLYLCNCYYGPNGRPRPLLIQPTRDLSGGSYAAYAQSSIRLTDRLSATLGSRFSHERKSVDAELLQLDPETFERTEIVVAAGTNRGRWNSLTWRAGLEYEASPELMFYGSASKGYKSGGFNSRPAINVPNLGLDEYDPETAVTLEAGFRSRWLQRRLRVNATVFSTSYRDIQLRRQTFSGGVLTTLIENAARARVRGMEVEAAAKLTDRLTANVAYGHLAPQYLDSRLLNLPLGAAFQRTPRHSFTASVDYSLPLGPNRVSLHGDYSYRSHEQFQLLPSEFDQSGYGLIGARLTFREARDRWSVALFGTNLADERYRAAGRGTGLREVGFANSVIGQPRQIGLEFKAGF